MLARRKPAKARSSAGDWSSGPTPDAASEATAPTPFPRSCLGSERTAPLNDDPHLPQNSASESPGTVPQDGHGWILAATTFRATGCPQLPQNFSLDSTGLPQRVQIVSARARVAPVEPCPTDSEAAITAWPQSLQNFSAGLISAPHCEQFIGILDFRTALTINRCRSIVRVQASPFSLAIYSD